MTKAQTYQSILDYFKDKPVSRIAIFGSYARNENTSTSDIDILLTPEKPIGLIGLSRFRLDLENLLGIHVDLGTENGLSAFIKPHIEKDKIIIYDRKG
ncbi:MAG: nucleotidyltransferase family protein [Bacteroidetes bacterium]|nr:nucleotidyltransferase family protein [Bacteroidota bacterium]